MKLCLIVLQNLGRQIQKGSSPILPEESETLSIPELAALMGCDVRQVNRVLEYLDKRKMAVVSRLAGERVVVHLSYRQWGTIEQSYADWFKATQIHKVTPEETEEPQDINVPNLTGSENLTPKPVTLKGGASPTKSRAIPVHCGIRTVRVQWQGKTLDVAFRSEINSGELVTTLWLPGEPYESAGDQSSRHGRLEHEQTLTYASRRKKGESDKRKESETQPPHPRAAEVCALFDPFLLRSCRRTLANDLPALSKACAEIGDIPKDWLVQGVIQRAARPINSPLHCAGIVKGIRLDWERSGKLPVPPDLKATEPAKKKKPTLAETCVNEVKRRIERWG
jgi:hypothetical protein